MNIKQIKERFEITDQIIEFGIDSSSVEAEEFVTWLNKDSNFKAELIDQTENIVTGEYKEDTQTGNTLINMLWETYCNS